MHIPGQKRFLCFYLVKVLILNVFVSMVGFGDEHQLGHGDIMCHHRDQSKP